MKFILELLNNMGAFISILISVASFIFAFYSWHDKRPKLSFKLSNFKHPKLLIKPDRISESNPDVYWNSYFRVIISGTFINSSSQPTSIISISLNDKYSVSPYITANNNYTVTYKNNKVMENGIEITLGQPKVAISIIMKDIQMKPIINIPGYSAVAGYMVMNIGDDPTNLNGKDNFIRVTTPLRKYKFTLGKLVRYDSALLPQEQYQSDYPRNSSEIR